jgi:uncharacterized membrane protein
MVWSRIWQSLALAGTVVVSLYAILLVINSVWLMDFRAWVVALMPMSPVRVQAFLGYLVLFSQTGRIYTGAFVATLFVVWMLAAFGDFAVTP